MMMKMNYGMVNIKQIIKEEIDSFEWAEDIPPKLTIDQLKKGDIYIYNHPTGAQFRLKYNHEPGITNEWGTTTTYAFDWMKNGERINFSPKDIERHMDSGKLVKESNDFDWTKKIEADTYMDLSSDYLEIWPRFEKMFNDLGYPVLEGTIQSNDWDGEMMFEIRSEDFMVDVQITQLFHEDGVGDLITWEMYDPDEYYRTRISGEYEPGGGDYLQPVIDKLRDLVVSLIDDYKTIQESNDFDWAEDTHEYEHYHKLEMVVYEDDDGTGMVAMDSFRSGQYDYLFEGTANIIMTYTLLLPKEGKAKWDEIEEFQRALYNEVLITMDTNGDPTSLGGDYVWNGTEFNQI